MRGEYDRLQEPSSLHFVFWDDVYVYDLNRMQNAPLAYRCAQGGRELPDLLCLLGVSPRAWLDLEQKLYSTPICLASGAVVLPLFGSVGRLVVVIKTDLPIAAFAWWARSAGMGEMHLDDALTNTVPAVRARDREAVEGFARTVAQMRMFICACSQANTVYQMEDCIALAAQIWGVTLMSQDTAELPAMQGQMMLPDMRLSGQGLVICLMTLISVIRNHAHARSGWLYTIPCENGAMMQAVIRCPAQAPLATLAHLRALLEDGGVVLAERVFVSVIKPPKQYAYMHRKITDPRYPLCARCGCLDARCASCTVVQWAVLPYVCDAALLGIKNCFKYEMESE